METTSTDATSSAEGALGSTDRVVAKVENFLNYIASIFIFLLMLLVVGEVIGRSFFNRPIPGTIDMVEVAIATFAFLGAAYCQRFGSHVRMELVVSRLRGRLMWAVEATAILISLVYILVIIDKSWEHFLRAYELGDSTMDIYITVWPSKLLVPIGLSVLALRLAIQLWGYLRLTANPDAEHIAVPVTLGVREQAQEEIREALGDEVAEQAFGKKPGDTPGAPAGGGN